MPPKLRRCRRFKIIERELKTEPLHLVQSLNVEDTIEPSRAEMGFEFSGQGWAWALTVSTGVGIGLCQTKLLGSEITAHYLKKQLSVTFKFWALSGLVKNGAGLFLGLRLLYCRPSIKPGPTGLGLGPFQLQSHQKTHDFW